MPRRSLPNPPPIEDAATRRAVERVVALARSLGGRAWWVGGCVRDALWGLPVRDVDLEVLGVEPENFVSAVRAELGGRVVGRDFPVLRIDGVPLDVSLPGAEVSLEQALVRRDFSVNAMAFDPERSEVHDPFGGLADLEARRLRHTSERFSEDPLRVLRGMQLVARFGLAPAPDTVMLCRRLSPEGIPPERIFEEWRKLVLLGVRPSLGLSFLSDTGWLRHVPELAALQGCPQDPVWHPEGDVWVHTLHCMDSFASERTGDAREDLIVGLAVLCHDLGKPATTRQEPERIRSIAHESAGVEPTRRLLTRMTRETELLVWVPRLVAAHLAPFQLHAQGSGDAAVRRLARRAGSIALLVRVAAADFAGRPPLPPRPFEAGEWLLDRARALGVLHGAPPPLLLGRHLISLGRSPGSDFGSDLEAAYEAQLDGVFCDEAGALDWARNHLATPGG